MKSIFLTTPWLTGRGLALASAAFTLGACAATAAGSRADDTSPAARATPTTAAAARIASLAAAPAAGSVVVPGLQEKRRAPHGKAEVTVLARGREAFVGRLRLEAGAKVPAHRDPTEEFIHVLSGCGTMTMNGERFEVGPDTTVYMPAGAEVSFENGGEPLVAVQVFADPGPEQKYAAWPAVRE